MPRTNLQHNLATTSKYCTILNYWGKKADLIKKEEEYIKTTINEVVNVRDEDDDDIEDDDFKIENENDGRSSSQTPSDIEPDKKGHNPKRKKKQVQFTIIL